MVKFHFQHLRNFQDILDAVSSKVIFHFVPIFSLPQDGTGHQVRILKAECEGEGREIAAAKLGKVRTKKTCPYD